MTEIEILRHHHGHELTELRAGEHMRREAAILLLRDAIDAIAIGAPGVAIRRIERAIAGLED